MQQSQMQSQPMQQYEISRRWGADLISRIPHATQAGSRCLEFGCGDGKAKALIEDYGYRWTGIDISGDKLTAQCDGHYLPFPDAMFDLVITVAVFEHLYDPFRAAREIYRVLKPGGTLLGTTAFLEHFHANSYFHMTHLGVKQVFMRAGFVVTNLWPTWSFAESLSTFWMPNQLGVPHRLLAGSARLAAGGLMRIRTWGLRRYLNKKGLSDDTINSRVQAEQLAWSGAIGFQACKPVTSDANGATSPLS